jgi:hypothetical protein
MKQKALQSRLPVIESRGQLSSEESDTEIDKIYRNPPQNKFKITSPSRLDTLSKEDMKLGAEDTLVAR